ncbi:MAG: arylsulfatase [Bacteroidales bacterium]|nr:arylsulfatase [Bacteroidales bacterium]
MKQIRVLFPAAAAVAGLGACSNGHALPENTKPNIIFILADDMGIGDVEPYGGKMIETPNISRLAQDGMLFTHHYSGSTVSAPSRCALMTGMDMGHAWIRGNAGTASGFDSALRPEDVTVAEILKAQGYATGCVGKWGLGGPDSQGRPGLQGFDYFCGYLSQGAAHNYYPDYLYENNEEVYLGGEVYSHFYIMEHGLQFMKEHINEPLFMYFAITPPHADLDYPDISHYDGKFEEVPWVNNPKSGRGYKSNPKPRATYASMVSEIDKNVGMVIDLLEKEGKLDNSIIIFSSDNGVHHVGGHDPDYFNSNGPFRGYKRDLYEGGIRTPFIVRWPGVVKPGSTTDCITTFWDFLPTVCDIVGAKTPDKIQGISYLPTLLGQKQKRTHSYIYYEFYEQGGKQSVMTTKDGWKLVRLNMNNPDKIVEELYNINDDIAEEHNRIKEFPEKADALRELAGYARTESELFKWKNK